MKILISILLVAFLGTTTVISVPFAELETAFSNNDAEKVMSYGKEKTMLNVLDKDGVYSKPQGTLVLKDFFTTYPSDEFKFMFKGNATGTSSFAIGDYSSGNNAFRVTLKFKKVGDNFKIESLTIEKE